MWLRPGNPVHITQEFGGCARFPVRACWRSQPQTRHPLFQNYTEFTCLPKTLNIHQLQLHSVFVSKCNVLVPNLTVSQKAFHLNRITTCLARGTLYKITACARTPRCLNQFLIDRVIMSSSINLTHILNR